MLDKVLFDEKKAKQVGFAFSLVLNDNELQIIKNSRRLFNRIISDKTYPIRFLAIAFHDEDVNEYGDKKTPHYHVVVDFENKVRLITCFNWIVKLVNLNENQVSIEKCADVGSQTRYLVHMDDADKYQYMNDIVITNNVKQLELYFSHFIVHDEQDLIDIIDRYPSKKRLFIVLGKKQYKEYRWIIHDLLNY